MCGINGIFAYHRAANAVDRSELIRSRDHMVARGPDGAGEWLSRDGRTGFGHRRLAIVDLTDGGAQPMSSADGSLVVIFNGEIYNYQELRRGLEAKGRVFRSSSDTEVLLHLYADKGEAMVQDLRGMFAFAIWENEAKTLFLARDPYGIKPLYVANDGWTFRFASQVKALLAGGKVSRDMEPAGVVGFHLWGSVPEPFTLYRDVRVLPAGHTQLVDVAGPREPKSYANIAHVFAAGAARRVTQDEIHAKVRAATRESVAAHLLADVEVGVFLSAGVDSGALLGLMRDAGQKKVRAVTLAFEEFRGTAEDESPLASEIARLYGAEHIVRVVGKAEFQADLPAILTAMDQPSIDGINTWFVAKAAREAGLKVAISGLGGDEILAGYPSFRDIPRWVSCFGVAGAIPGMGVAARALIQAAGVAAKNPKAASLLEFGGTYPGAYLLRRGLFLPHELRDVLAPDTVRIGLRRLNPQARVHETMAPILASAVSKVAAMESANYMRHQLLRDADWAGMAHSLEIRTPLVDFDLLRALSGITPSLAPGTGKRALASAPSTPLPTSIVNRPKTGFGIPTGRWTAAASANTVVSKGAASRAWAREVFVRLGNAGPNDEVAAE
jgi:asparagine synthase (glutamine-hydrolysing)